MKCDQCKDKLKEYIEGNLSTEADEELKIHLLTCEECNKVYEEEKLEYELFKEAFSFDYIDFKDSKDIIMGAIDKDRYKGNKGFFVKHKKLVGTIAAIFILGVIGTPIVNNIINGEDKLESAALRNNNSPKESSMENGGYTANEEMISTQELDNEEKNDDMALKNSSEGTINLYLREEVDNKTELEFNTPYIKNESNNYEASIEGKGENAVEEGEGKVYIKDSKNNKLYRYSSLDERGSYSALYINWYDDTHLMIIHGLSYGTLFNGTNIVMLDVTTGEQVLIATASEKDRERYTAVERSGDKLIIKTIVYLDDSLNEYKELNKEISNYTLGEMIK